MLDNSFTRSTGWTRVLKQWHAYIGDPSPELLVFASFVSSYWDHILYSPFVRRPLGLRSMPGRRWRRLWTLPSAAWVLGFGSLFRHSGSSSMAHSVDSPWAYCLLETLAHTLIHSILVHSSSNQATEALASSAKGGRTRLSPSSLVDDWWGT